MAKKKIKRHINSTNLYEDEKLQIIAHMMICRLKDDCSICSLASKYLESENKKKANW